jgi:CheY-like chemotaxis protein
MRVLIVDDEADARELVTVMLGHCGAGDESGRSSGEALEIIENWKPDVLIADIGARRRWLWTHHTFACAAERTRWKHAGALH